MQEPEYSTRHPATRNLGLLFYKYKFYFKLLTLALVTKRILAHA